MDKPSRDEEQVWIEINDPEISSMALAREVAARVQRRRAELGPVAVDFPAFGPAAPVPNAGRARGDVTRLHYFLRRFDQLPPPETQPELAASPATQLPVLGRLWQTVRREAHNLVLFYVNRAVAHHAASNRHVADALNELATLVQAQQAEIERLRKELAQLEEERER